MGTSFLIWCIENMIWVGTVVCPGKVYFATLPASPWNFPNASTCLACQAAIINATLKGILTFPFTPSVSTKGACTNQMLIPSPLFSSPVSLKGFLGGNSKGYQIVCYCYLAWKLVLGCFLLALSQPNLDRIYFVICACISCELMYALCCLLMTSLTQPVAVLKNCVLGTAFACECVSFSPSPFQKSLQNLSWTIEWDLLS